MHDPCIFLIPRSNSEAGDDNPSNAPPAAKRSTHDIRIAGELSSSPPTPGVGEGGALVDDLSPEQKERMAVSKLEAESRRIAAMVGAEKLGSSWVKALLSEFKKPYIKEVCETMHVQTSRKYRAVAITSSKKIHREDFVKSSI